MIYSFKECAAVLSHTAHTVPSISKYCRESASLSIYTVGTVFCLQPFCCAIHNLDVNTWVNQDTGKERGKYIEMVL